VAGAFATAICGSQDLYGHNNYPYNSINFVTAHDGYSLTDLVSYQDKHNLANGEKNNDGANDNHSWNCGHEGKTQNRKILALREKQKKNFLVALMLSIGTPMVLMGDEYGHTREGNNNPYCQDNELNWFLWDELKKNNNFFAFFKFLIAFRKAHSHLLCRESFLSSDDILWHGKAPLSPDWTESSRLVCYTLKDPQGHDLYVAFNAYFNPIQLRLPEAQKGKHWHKVIDTSKEHQETPSKHEEKFTYKMEPYSAIVLKSL